MSSIVTITAEQLPEALRPAFKEYEEAQHAAGEARRALNTAAIADKHTLKPVADKAVADAHAAHTALCEATRAQPSAMRDYSNAAFHACVERAREHLAAAEAELRAAAGHAAVWGSVRPGRPTVNVERGDQTPGRLRAMFAVGQVREAVDALPEDVE
jgi:hypothetical protein